MLCVGGYLCGGVVMRGLMDVRIGVDAWASDACWTWRDSTVVANARAGLHRAEDKVGYVDSCLQLCYAITSELALPSNSSALVIAFLTSHSNSFNALISLPPNSSPINPSMTPTLSPMELRSISMNET